MRGIVEIGRAGVLFLLSTEVEAFVSRSSRATTTTTTTNIVPKHQRQHHQRLTYSNSKLINSDSNRNSKLLFAQWNDDDEDDSDTANKDVKISPSYEEAGKTIGTEDDKATLDDVGDFDASPGYVASDVGRYRDAIKKRADKLGIDKLTLAEKEAFENQARAKALNAKENPEGSMGGVPKSASASPGDISQMLDLTQISMDQPKTGPEDGMPAFMYDPAKDMTEEEMIEADPTGQLPIWEQFTLTLGKAKYPPPSELVVEVIILVVTITVTATVIYSWDNLMRECAFYFSMVPRPEETLQNMEGMVLPDDPGPLVGADMLKQLQEGAKQTLNSVQDGTLLEQLQQQSGTAPSVPSPPPVDLGPGPGNVPQDL
mmetsp:Transcript_1683/g.1828  ORF Transcript_1683/g.1828 Transcript_1683/m.1828 type:complete len:372 (-) Transcript_1683:86-1201(-)